MAGLLQRFRELRAPPAASDVLSVTRLSARSSVWVACDSLARPVVLIETDGSSEGTHGVVLRNFSFEPWVTCKITEQGKPARQMGASIVRCTALERELHGHFLRALSPSCEELGLQPRVSDIALIVDKLVEVFQSLSQPSHESVQGLWAELLLISLSHDIELATEAWQRRARSLIDFERDRCGVEVKSTSDGARQHRFMLAQLRPPAGEQRFVASLVTLNESRGASITDLWENIERRLRQKPLLRDKIAARVAQVLGEDWQQGHSQRFNLQAAVDSLLVFDVATVPRVGEQAPSSISDIEFTVDFSALAPVDRGSLVERDLLLAAIFLGPLSGKST